jgi:hypothetical protein
MGKVTLFLVEAPNGKYVNISPALLKKDLQVQKGNHMEGLSFRFFGFLRHYASSLQGQTRVEALKEFVDVARSERDRLFPDSTSAYMLVNIKQDEDAGTYWSLVVDYQFLLWEIP